MVELDKLHDVIVQANKFSVQIDFIKTNSETIQLELTLTGAEMLLDDLQYALNKV